MSFRRVLVTGISGARSSDCLVRLQSLMGHDQLELHSIGHAMLRLARESGMSFESGNILNAPKDTLTALRVAAFERMQSQMASSPRLQIVDVHATFLMKSGLKEGLSFSDVKKFSPDLMVTLIDGPQRIYHELKEHPGKYLHLTVADIVKWQEFEVYITNMFARIVGARHFVVAQNQVETLKKILQEIDTHPPVYVSYPMTHLPDEEKPKIEKFVQFLSERFTVFDPAAVDSSHDLQPYFTEEDKRAISNHTIVRDLEWMIGINSEKVIAYLPKIVFSSGMNDELRYGHETGKETFIVLEHTDQASLPSLSPFTEYKSRVFWSATDFAYYLDLSDDLKSAYDWCEERAVDLLKQRRVARSVDFESEFSVQADKFEAECLSLCQYNFPDPKFQSLRNEIVRVIHYIYHKWNAPSA